MKKLYRTRMQSKLFNSEAAGKASPRQSTGNIDLPKMCSQGVPGLKTCKEENSVRKHLPYMETLREKTP